MTDGCTTPRLTEVCLEAPEVRILQTGCPQEHVAPSKFLLLLQPRHEAPLEVNSRALKTITHLLFLGFDSDDSDVVYLRLYRKTRFCERKIKDLLR